MRTNQTIIGLDIGRSTVKVKASADGQDFETIVFPAIASQGYAATAFGSDAWETVELEGEVFFIGETARAHGQTASSGGRNDWFTDRAYGALVRAAINRLEEIGVPGLDDPLVVTGTPSDLIAKQRDAFAHATKRYTGGTVKVLTQPIGVYIAWTHAQNGMPIVERMQTSFMKKSWAVVDVGHYTTDFLLMSAGQYVESKSVSAPGILPACEHLALLVKNEHGVALTPLACEEAMLTKKFRNFFDISIPDLVMQAARYAATPILERADLLFARDVASYDGVLVAGGGAPIVYEALKERWLNAVLVPNPRTAIVEGYLLYGKSMQHRALIAAQHPGVTE